MKSELIERLCALNWHANRLHRLAHRLHRSGHPNLAMIVAGANRILTGVEIPATVEFGEGLVIKHGNGIVVEDWVRAGRNLTIFQQVTLGTPGVSTDGSPVIGDGVTIYAGAKVFGSITIGDNAKIGANAVVLTDVPANATAVGVPARIYVDGKPV